MNVHVAWRMAVARRAAREYAGNGKLAALAVAGSVGAGLADRFSDLELDCYWSAPPSDADRTGPAGALGGELTGFWEYDQAEREWSEDYRLGDLGVTVSNFLAATVHRFLDDVLLGADTDPVKHMRLAALQRSRPLLGAELITSWRERAGSFPSELVSALVLQALDPEVLTGWAGRDALASRGDDLAARDLLTRAGQAVVRAVLALNRVYLPHRQLKWQCYLIAGLQVAPESFAERLASLSASPPAKAFQAAETLLADTVLLAEEHTAADLTPFRDALADRRRPIDPPPARGDRAGRLSGTSGGSGGRDSNAASIVMTFIEPDVSADFDDERIEAVRNTLTSAGSAEHPAAQLAGGFTETAQPGLGPAD